MKCSIDISVVSQQGLACGTITGELEFANIPQIGETVSFLFPRDGFKGQDRVPKLDYLLKVERVIHSPLGIYKRDKIVTLMLEDLIIDDECQTTEVFRFFEEGFRLFSNPFLEKDL